MSYKEFSDLLMQFYNVSIIALAIILLAVAIITYPTLKKHSQKGR